MQFLVNKESSEKSQNFLEKSKTTTIQSYFGNLNPNQESLLLSTRVHCYYKLQLFIKTNIYCLRLQTQKYYYLRIELKSYLGTHYIKHVAINYQALQILLKRKFIPKPEDSQQLLNVNVLHVALKYKHSKSSKLLMTTYTSTPPKVYNILIYIMLFPSSSNGGIYT